MFLFCYFLLFATPSMASVAGFYSSLIFIQRISNQWPSDVQVIVVFFLAILGMVAGDFIGYFLCPNKVHYGGWEFNWLPDIFIFFGRWIGATMIPLLTSYFLATTQQWVNNQGLSNDQILFVWSLIILEIIIGIIWLYFLYWINNEES